MIEVMQIIWDPLNAFQNQEEFKLAQIEKELSPPQPTEFQK